MAVKLVESDLNSGWTTAQVTVRVIQLSKASSNSPIQATEASTKNYYDKKVVDTLQTPELDLFVQLKMTYFPTSIVELLDKNYNPLVEIKIVNKNKSTNRIRLSSQIEAYSTTAIHTVEVDRLSEVTINQLPLLTDKANKLNEVTSATLNVLIEDIDKRITLSKFSFLVQILPRNEFVMELRDPSTEKIIDLSRYLGAFVTPNAPIIMKFLRLAAKRHPEGRLYGYQREVLLQVKAIFEALKEDTSITYVESPIIFNPEENSKTQRVRFPRESLEELQANCIDATLLFVSILEAASLNPTIVVIPKWVLLGWQNQPDQEVWSYLETTMIGTATFEEAMDMGQQKAERFEKLVVSDPMAFRRWSLRELRTKYQIMPLE